MLASAVQAALQDQKAHQQDGDADLKQDPHHDDDVATNEEGSAVIYGCSVRIEEDEFIYPGFSSSEAEHGGEGAVERAEAPWSIAAEQRDPHDRI